MHMQNLSSRLLYPPPHDSPPPTDLDVALVAAGDEVLLCGVERHALDGGLVRGEPVPHLPPPHVEDAHAAPLTARDQQL